MYVKCEGVARGTKVSFNLFKVQINELYMGIFHPTGSGISSIISRNRYPFWPYTMHEGLGISLVLDSWTGHHFCRETLKIKPKYRFFIPKNCVLYHYFD